MSVKAYFVGIMMASHLVFQTAAAVIINGGFEASGSTTGGRPTTVGHWQGDWSSIVAGPDSGINAREGSQMLKFLYAGSTEGASTKVTSSVYQLIDLTDILGLVQSGNASASLSAYFNRIQVDAQTDTQFSVSLSAFSGLPADFPTATPLGTASSPNLFSDSNTSTWEQSSVNLAIPTTSTYLAVAIKAQEDIFNDTTGTEFDGHFADDVSFQVVPEPSAYGLVIGLILCGWGTARRLYRRQV